MTQLSNILGSLPYLRGKKIDLAGHARRDLETMRDKLVVGAGVDSAAAACTLAEFLNESCLSDLSRPQRLKILPEILRLDTGAALHSALGIDLARPGYSNKKNDPSLTAQIEAFARDWDKYLGQAGRDKILRRDEASAEEALAAHDVPIAGAKFAPLLAHCRGLRGPDHTFRRLQQKFVNKIGPRRHLTTDGAKLPGRQQIASSIQDLTARGAPTSSVNTVPDRWLPKQTKQE